MSNRLTPDWVDDLEEVFGASGVKGDAGERWVIKKLIEYGIPAKLSKNHCEMQTSGVDIFAAVHFDFSTDVKNNVKSNGNFPIYFDWLFDPQKISEYIIHVNVETGQVYWYLRDEAQQYLNNIRKTQNNVWHEPGNYLPFVQKGWTSLIKHIENNV